MHLYDKDENDNILVYNMKLNRDKVHDYKKKVAFHEIVVYSFQTNDENAPFNYEEAKEQAVTDFSVDELSYKRLGLFGSIYHSVEPLKCNSTNVYYITRLIRDYCDSAFNKFPLVRLYQQDSNGDKEFTNHLLVVDDYTYEREHRKQRYIKDVLDIGKDLFCLELLGCGHFSLLEEYDISEQIKLFDFSSEPTLIVPEDDLKVLTEAQLVTMDKNIESKINNSQKVLTYARQQGFIKK